MLDLTDLVAFRLDEQRYALPLMAVERVIRAVDVTPLPDAPPVVCGVMDMHGDVLPVLNIRGRFGLPDRKIDPADQFLIAQTTQRTMVLVVDETLGVIRVPRSALIDSAQIVPGLDYVQGVVKLDDGLVLIHNLEKFLSMDEARSLDEAMDRDA
ncbi:MAG: chemotaxis protein CheW [Gammaproteobacteria bacterium]